MKQKTKPKDNAENAVLIPSVRLSENATSGKGRIILLVSTGQENAIAGEKLNTLLYHLINVKRIDPGNIEILNADSLQRHTLAIVHHCDEEQAMQLALEQGGEWLENNQSIAGKYGVKISRWDDWWQQGQGVYAKYAEQIQQLYSESSEFQQAVDQTAAQWVRAAQKKGILQVTEQQAKEARIQYLLEELSILCPFFAEKNVSDIIYPFAATPAIKTMIKLCDLQEQVNWQSVSWKSRLKQEVVHDLDQAYMLLQYLTLASQRTPEQMQKENLQSKEDLQSTLLNLNYMIMQWMFDPSMRQQDQSYQMPISGQFVFFNQTQENISMKMEIKIQVSTEGEVAPPRSSLFQI